MPDMYDWDHDGKLNTQERLNRESDEIDYFTSHFHKNHSPINATKPEYNDTDTGKNDGDSAGCCIYFFMILVGIAFILASFKTGGSIFLIGISLILLPLILNEISIRSNQTGGAKHKEVKTSDPTSTDASEAREDNCMDENDKQED